MQIRAKFTRERLALHRRHHFAAYHECAYVSSFCFFDEFLNEYILIQAVERLDHGTSCAFAFRQYNADALGALQKFHDDGWTFHLFDAIGYMFCLTSEYSRRNPNVMPTE